MPLLSTNRLSRTAIVLATAVIAGSTTATAGPLPAAASLPTIGATQNLGPITQNSNILFNGAYVAGRDNGQSADYDGNSVWIFNDTILTNGSFLSSTAAMTDDLDASDGITLTSASPFTPNDTGVPNQTIPMTLSEFAFQATHNGNCTTATDPYCGSVFAYWPGSIVADPARHRLLTFYGKLCRGQNDQGDPCYNGFAGQLQGGGVAALDVDNDTVTRLSAQNMPAPITSVDGADPTLLWGPDQMFGNGSAVIQGDTLYAYGACANFRCGLGKVPLASVQDRAQWTYYSGQDGSGNAQWSTDPSAAIAIMDSGAAGGTVAWNAGLNEWLDTYMQPLSNTAMYEVAPNPWGPWSSAQTMFNAQPPSSGVDYALYAHPEYATNNGLTQYVSYYQPGTGYQMLEQVDFTPGN